MYQTSRYRQFEYSVFIVISYRLPIFQFFQQPDRSTWGCTDIWYVIEATPTGRQPQTYQVRADPSGQQMEHKIPTELGLEWRVRIQTANSGGVSPWSPEILIKTSSEGIHIYMKQILTSFFNGAVTALRIWMLIRY